MFNVVENVAEGTYLSEEERATYIDYMAKKYPDILDGTLTITVGEGDFVDLVLDPAPVKPFERIRRITGYLVGDLKRFNDGKLAEVNDRVKHDMGNPNEGGN